MPDISVIIPTYNRRELLPRAIDSVLKQKGVSFELIIVDDGSTDGTEKRLQEKFPKRYTLYANRSQKGPASARNLGIKHAKGKWIAFLDSDDEWLPEKLKAQLSFFKENPDYLINQTEEIWIRNGKRVNPMKKHKKVGGHIFGECLPLCVVSPSAVMINKKIFKETGLFDESLPACEDYDLWLRISAKYPIGLIKTPYIKKYGGHKDQRSHEFPAMDRFRISSLVKIIRSGILTSNQEDLAKKMLEKKSKIYIGGALKRNKIKEIAAMKKLLTSLN